MKSPEPANSTNDSQPVWFLFLSLTLVVAIVSAGRCADPDPQGWTAPTRLRDSVDQLKWINAQQKHLARLHRPHPSFVRQQSPIRAAVPILSEMPPEEGTIKQVTNLEPINTGLVLDPPDGNLPATGATVSAPRLPDAGEPASRPADVSKFAKDSGVSALALDQDAQTGRAELELPSLIPTDHAYHVAQQPQPSDDLEAVFPGRDSNQTDETGQSQAVQTPESAPGEVADEVDSSTDQMEDDTSDDVPLPQVPQAAPPSDEAPAELPPPPLRVREPETPSEAPPSDSQPVPPANWTAASCDDKVRQCQDAWELLRAKPITAISLDITPSVGDEVTDPLAVERARQEKLASTAVRAWHDEQQAVIAEGRMSEFRHGKVHIQTPSGRVQKVPYTRLSDDDRCYVADLWQVPFDCSFPKEEYEVRDWTLTTFTWTASALCHKPLYFEDVELERYGHSAGPVRQAFLSGVHFFGNVFFLPYHIGMNPPNECQYSLGYYRPGSCAPWLLPAVPLSARGARAQMTALTGALTLLP